MKIIYLMFLLFTVTAYAQDSLLTFSEVVEVPGATKDQLFIKARQWFNNSFKNSKNVLQIADKEAGELSGKGITVVKVLYHMLGADHKNYWDCNFTVNIWVKDGKYKYEFTSIEVNDSGEQRKFRTLTTASEANYKVTWASKKTVDNLWVSMKKGASEEFSKNAFSLKNAMNEKTLKSDF